MNFLRPLSKLMATKTPTKKKNIQITDPRQQSYLAYFFDPKSPTYSNTLQSALKAGFSQEYAENLTSLMPNWLSDYIGKQKASTLLEKAERNLDEMLDLPSKIQAMGAFGPLYNKVITGSGKKKKVRKIPIMVHAVGLLKIKNDTSQFVAERIGRKVYGDKEDAPPDKTSVVNMVQIIINAPQKNAGGSST